MIDYKKSKAPATTITVDTRNLDKGTGNIYESVVICSKRANQISVEMKQELNRMVVAMPRCCRFSAISILGLKNSRGFDHKSKRGGILFFVLSTMILLTKSSSFGKP